LHLSDELNLAAVEHHRLKQQLPECAIASGSQRREKQFGKAIRNVFTANPRDLAPFGRRNKAGAEATMAEDVEEKMTDYAAPLDEDDGAMGFQNFVPPVFKANARGVRKRLKDFQANLKGALTDKQRVQLDELYRHVTALLRQEIMQQRSRFRSSKNDSSTLRAVVYGLLTVYRAVYSPVRESICNEEAEDLAALTAIIAQTPSLSSRPEQPVKGLAALLEHALAVKTQRFDPFFKDMVRQHAGVAFFPAALKGIWRCIEKTELRADPTNSFEHICDIVRGAVSSNSVASLVGVYADLLACPRVAIQRVKNRLHKPTDGGWADCLINFVFTDDPHGHICEIQLVHDKLMLVRKNMGTYESYAFYRSAVELLEATDTRRWKEECALVELYVACHGPRWNLRGNWCSAVSVNLWHGIEVGQGRLIVSLNLSMNNLSGMLLRCTVQDKA
jgi:hypothetical protein